MGRIDALSPTTHQRHTATDVFDTLYWWEQHEQSYPILSDCARRATGYSSILCRVQTTF